MIDKARTIKCFLIGGVLIATYLAISTLMSTMHSHDEKVINNAFAACEKNPKSCPGFEPKWKRESNIDWQR